MKQNELIRKWLSVPGVKYPNEVMQKWGLVEEVTPLTTEKPQPAPKPKTKKPKKPKKAAKPKPKSKAKFSSGRIGAEEAARMLGVTAKTLIEKPCFVHLRNDGKELVNGRWRTAFRLDKVRALVEKRRAKNEHTNTKQ